MLSHGTFITMKKNPTLQDIADKTGVSIATVSRIINKKENEGIKISRKTREVVLHAIEEMDYHPNLLAKSLATNKTFTIGVIVPEIIESFFPEVIQGVENVAGDKGYNVILCDSNENAVKEIEEVEFLKSRRVDGLIVGPSRRRSNFKYYEKLKEEGLPIVLCGRAQDDCKIDYVVTDNEHGAYEMTQHMIKQGLKNIIYLNDPPFIPKSMPRLIGYKQALEENGLKPQVIKSDDSWFRLEDGYKLMQQYLKKNKKPDAIFAVNDPTAIGAIKAIHEAGMKVPDDISVVGFSDMRYSDAFSPSLTTVFQPKIEMGVKSCEILFSKIENQSEDIQQIKLPCKLVIRESCL
jgi:LacI family transcriptional regulator